MLGQAAGYIYRCATGKLGPGFASPKELALGTFATLRLKSLEIGGRGDILTAFGETLRGWLIVLRRG